MFLKVCIKPQNFPVVLEPWRLDSWNVIVLWSPSVLEKSELRDTFSEFVNQVFINFLLNVLFFLLYTSINKVELLSLVEALFIRIAENVARKERNLLGNIFLHSLYFIYKLYFVNAFSD